MSEKDDWKWIQEKLGLSADGVPGSRTAESVRRFMGEVGKEGSPAEPSTGGCVDDMEIAQVITDLEARRDSQGRIKAYAIPPGDGGGKWEVAGICDRYHPEETAKLVRLLDAGKYEEAEREVNRYWIKYTDVVRNWFADAAEYGKHPGLVLFLRDSCVNRGPGGAAKILQMALVVPVDGKVGKQTKSELLEHSTNPGSFLDKLRSARELYERATVGRNESSKFWKGLVNRWNKITKTSKEMENF